MQKLKPDVLREIVPTAEELSSIKRRPVYIIVENVLDTYNVGAIFRLADAIAAEKVYLVGDTATPADPKVGHKIHKASVGVWQWVPWEYVATVREAVEKARESVIARNPEVAVGMTKQSRTTYEETSGLPQSLPLLRNDEGLKIYAIEQDAKSISYTTADYSGHVAFIVGHETTGVSKEALKLADEILEIPMYGVNSSMNVMVCLAIVLWESVKNS